jgi:hypothetical protein
VCDISKLNLVSSISVSQYMFLNYHEFLCNMVLCIGALD